MTALNVFVPERICAFGSVRKVLEPAGEKHFFFFLTHLHILIALKKKKKSLQISLHFLLLFNFALPSQIN